jgi:arylsulfatase A-like enzyme
MRLISHLSIALLVTLAVAVAPAAAEPAPRKPNVLFIAFDDLRPELGCYGTPVIQSPNIDALAKTSLVFDHAYCQLALCNPSRSSFLSGLRPETLDVFTLKKFLRTGNPDLVTLPQLFKNNGYTSLSFGKIFHTGNGNHEDDASWSEKAWKPGANKANAAAVKAPPGAANDANPDNEDPHANDLPAAAPDVADEDLPDGQVATAAIAALDRLAKHPDQPFFLGVGFYKPHMPWVAPKKYWDLYKESDIPLATNPFPPKDSPAFASNNASEIHRYHGVPKANPLPDDLARHMKQGYYACVSYSDAQLGKVLAKLDELHLRDSTIIVLLGDHGYQLGEHATWNKRTNWEIATHAPLMISFPNMPTAGRHTPKLAEFLDIYPTLAECCHLTPPKNLQGRSLLPVLNDLNAPTKDAAFSVYQKNIPELGGTSRGHAMRTDRYRFIEWTGPTKDKAVHELYDVQSDPNENTNLANLPEN